MTHIYVIIILVCVCPYCASIISGIWIKSQTLSFGEILFAKSSAHWWYFVYLPVAAVCLLLPCITDTMGPVLFHWLMMTSSNGNIFRVTGLLCGEFTGPGEFPTQRPVTQSFDVFFDLHLNKRLSKQPWGWWFETPSWSFWRQCNVLMIATLRFALTAFPSEAMGTGCLVIDIPSMWLATKMKSLW